MELNEGNFKNWVNDIPPNTKIMFHRLMNMLENPNPKILEIGTFCGISIIEMLKYLPNAYGVCIDLWEKSVDPILKDFNMGDIEAIFDSNIKKANLENRITKLKGDSKKILNKLDRNTFDLIYVDGSHTAFDTYCDLIFSWKLLKPKGIMIIDDYLWMPSATMSPLDIPFHAINHFLNIIDGGYNLLYKEYRVAIQKKEDFDEIL